MMCNTAAKHATTNFARIIESFFLHCLLVFSYFTWRSAVPQIRHLASARPIRIFWFGFVFVLLNYDQIVGTVVATGVKVTAKAVGKGFISTVIIAPCKTAVSCQKTVYTKLLTPFSDPDHKARHVNTLYALYLFRNHLHEVNGILAGQFTLE